jgi:indolepyruvate ferredoxin oxidoreductase beta subunit
MQQIIISGVGGQGILFVTKLLAETALESGLSVLISETHGMAQRGGNVISHLKVSKREPGVGAEPFVSPLIRPGRADLLLALHPDGEALHRYYLKDSGAIISNRTACESPTCLDADRIAMDLGSPVSANLVLLGFAAGSKSLFCSPEQLRATLERLGGKRLEASLKAFQAGWDEAVRVSAALRE